MKLCNGKMVNVEACRKGFYSVGKQRILCHNIVDLLGQLSRAFDNVSSFSPCSTCVLDGLVFLTLLSFKFDNVHTCALFTRRLVSKID